ncbi:lipocalin-like domain-containing protein [Aliifodinibius sp. S!AR15-10]|uniref:lipocalin-like domain-containing protein n=1 Tax=Aliifodinibius sp. S!AR15-10 TaxID=2950437 RepID=UPI00285EDF80|nr:lipocalin-like domain-containing protein [Aliifodinibius sp. S!AR15-10]MDR8391687.1 lipocalin-like domain-containing protein [Aliifodinibius sp. S!AR15-10]
MKTSAIILISALLALLSSINTGNESPLEGVWQLESASYTNPDTTFYTDMEEWQQIKVITGDYHVWMGQNPNRDKFTEGGTDAELLAAARTFGAGGGAYTIEGNKYIEHVDYFLNPNFTGTSIEFTYKMEGNDKWIQTGVLPMKSLGLEEYDLELREVWVRID